GPVHDFIRRVQQLRDTVAKSPAEIQALQSRLLASGKANGTLLRLVQLKHQMEKLGQELAGFLDGCDRWTFAELKDQCALIEGCLGELPDFMRCLREAAGLPGESLAVLRRLPLTPVELEAAMAARSWEEMCRADRALHRFTGAVRSRHVQQLEKSHDKLY